ncbi:hypothetical protein PRIPAC_87059 [Pristionchus pacificus]|uniref:Uncharacterized protein n=1 Tax=Pristionchus pacificus TaxID=54126 RepID=A0A2A6BV75_PRIPA|nr:hypothetical protein PRIPAC_87059 [Pristionchus pacificus]|eukprot:PDM69768.1 hypothetical protein PRIPAC_44864 [Pristionchus pacificus]
MVTVIASNNAKHNLIYPINQYTISSSKAIKYYNAQESSKTQATDFFIEQVISQGRTLYFCYYTPKGEYIGPAHEHTHQLEAIKEWINRTVAEKGLTAFDYLAHEYIKQVLEMSLEDWVAREESRNETEESSEDR